MNSEQYTQSDPLENEPVLMQARERAFEEFSRGLGLFQTVRVDEPARVLWIDSKRGVNELIIGINYPNFMDKRACTLAMNSRPGRGLEAINRHLKRLMDPASTREEEPADFLRALKDGQIIGDWPVIVVVELLELQQFSAWLGRVAAAGRGSSIAPEQPPAALTGDDWRHVYDGDLLRQYWTHAGRAALDREDPFAFIRGGG